MAVYNQCTVLNNLACPKFDSAQGSIGHRPRKRTEPRDTWFSWLESCVPLACDLDTDAEGQGAVYQKLSQRRFLANGLHSIY